LQLTEESRHVRRFRRRAADSRCWRLHGQSGFERFSRIKPVLFMIRLTKASLCLRPPFRAPAGWVLGLTLHNRPKREVPWFFQATGFHHAAKCPRLRHGVV
jgi:hypothetical protein